MTVAAAAGIEVDDRLARRNVLVLALAQALAGGNTMVIFATGSITGAMLAPAPSLATLPITAFVVGLWAGTLPVGYLSRVIGRRAAFQVGTAFGTLTGLVSTLAVLQSSFALLLAGSFCGGLYAAAHQAYRFAAADTASPAFQPRAISLVLAGGLLAAFTGPQLAIHTKDFWPPYLFLATYLGQAALAVLAGLVLAFLRIPRPRAAAGLADRTRPLSEIMRQPRFIVAVACGVVSYSAMNFVMTASPLAMVGCGHSITDATLGQQWHVIAMYGPSFFTGSLIARFGTERLIGAGLVLFGASASVAMSGTSVAHFWIALILLGLAWNFGFVGATAMVTECHRPSERSRVQSFNDFLIFGAMMLGSFGSGQILATAGWTAVNQVVVPAAAAAAALLGWLMLRSRKALRE